LVWDGLELDLDLFGDPAQREVVHLLRAIAVERGDQDRHVVDLDRLHHPARDRRRNQIAVRLELAVDLEKAVLPILAHEEAHGDDRAAGERHRVDGFDAVDLGEQLLEPCGDLSFDFLDGEPGRLDPHVSHRHDDLRLFLARREPERKRAARERERDQERREPTDQEQVDHTTQEGSLAAVSGHTPSVFYFQNIDILEPSQ
jgi:hypothetical protein